jgi:hypothetical protein
VAIGPCEYMTCRSSLGSAFRAWFEGGGLLEVLICPEHEKILRAARERGGRLAVTPDQAVYLVGWLDSLGAPT